MVLRPEFTHILDGGLIVLLPEAVNSREVRAELRTALNQEKVIVPVLYKRCNIPRQLNLIQHIDFTSRDPNDETAIVELLRALGISTAFQLAPQTMPQESTEPLDLALPEDEEPSAPVAPPDRHVEIAQQQAPEPTIAPFSPQEARQYQQIWAEHLGIPVEIPNSINMEFILIPAGEFLMGSNDGRDNEKPVGFPGETEKIWNMCDNFAYSTSMIM